MFYDISVQSTYIYMYIYSYHSRLNRVSTVDSTNQSQVMHELLYIDQVAVEYSRVLRYSSTPYSFRNQNSGVGSTVRSRSTPSTVLGVLTRDSSAGTL
jgi:hypothetical protein